MYYMYNVYVCYLNLNSIMRTVLDKRVEKIRGLTVRAESRALVDARVLNGSTDLSITGIVIFDR